MSIKRAILSEMLTPLICFGRTTMSMRIPSDLKLRIINR